MRRAGMFGLVVAAALGPALASEGAPTAIVRELRSRLVDHPEVVVVGNSKVRTDLDLDSLRAALAAPAPAIAGLGVPGTQAPVWFAVAAESVFGTGERPRGLVIYGTLAGALTTTLPNANARAALAAHLTPASRASLARPFGAPLTADLLHAYTAAGGPACLAERAAPPELPAAVTPLPPSASFFAELLTLARENGARPIFVRQPLAPSGNLDDEVPAVEERAARALVQAAGGGWIDLRAELRDERYYGDGVHMNAAGRRAATAALARQLNGLGDWLGSAPPFPAAAPAEADPPHWTTAPAAPPLAFAEVDACTLVAKLPPALAAVSPEALAAAGFAGASPVGAALRGAALRAGPPGGGCTASWSVQGDQLTVAVAAKKGAALTATLPASPEVRGVAGLQGWWAGPGATLEAEGGAGAQTLRGWAPVGGATIEVGGAVTELAAGPFTMPAPGGTLRVRSDRAWVIVQALGPRVAPAPRTFDLLEAAVTANAPPPLPALALAATRGRAWQGTGSAEALGVPEVDDAFAESGVGACSPLRVDDAYALSVREGRATATTRDCSALPAAWSLPVRLADDRGCPRGHGRWLYPGDAQRWELTAGSGGGSWSIELAGGVLGAADGENVAVRVSDAAGTLFEGRFAAGRLREDPPRWPLSRAPEGRVVVTVDAPRYAPWVLLGRAALVESTS